MPTINMSIEFDVETIDVSTKTKDVSGYCCVNIHNTFEKFAKAIGGDKLWFDIVDTIARNHGYKKPNYNKVASDPIPRDCCENEDWKYKQAPKERPKELCEARTYEVMPEQNKEECGLAVDNTAERRALKVRKVQDEGWSISKD